ncbi:cobyrinic acid a,c-diamide synthase [Ammonifex degensii KC4]|uniref:Cobyrinate a,c-diamide synthase n=1 Tax=Ammonifex degensii (strain DSM 10501 / KC4) TaxID=429009 RepID=C9RAS8_AMMDK|nr:cobyrinate a,c-diamide synthase [Ammonifex degensii]ACX51355.1 cobyrinic acid a,c-diamide synthase [Ammonifex degensii KC4]
MKRLVVAGAESGSGKTTVTLGLMAAFRRRGLKVQGFKVGPDYIDPGFHTAVTGRVARNLDPWLMPEEVLCELFLRGSRGADLAIVEGVMGLYDGRGSLTEGSTAELSKILRAPVVLVVAARGMSTSAAAVVLGFKAFDPEVRLEGVIFTGVGSEKHARLLREVVESRVGVKVFGCLPRLPELELPSRHLGLVPAAERSDLKEYAARLADVVEANLDLDGCLTLASTAPPLLPPATSLFPPSPRAPQARIAVAYDQAFSFYYPENLELLEAFGAEIAPFSPCEASTLPEGSSALYLGGGFPEVFAHKLSANLPIKKAIRAAVEKGMPVYAECGGLIYLCSSLAWKGEEFQLVGALPFKVTMGERLKRLGYVVAEVLTPSPFFRAGEKVRGHVFHYSRLEGESGLPPAFRLRRSGGEVEAEGVVYRRTLASYLHLHFASFPALAERLVEAAALYRREGIL